MKIDLGCGYNKQPGYIGIDRYETPDTKIVCDFDVNIPLDDNSVDYVMASHSLEHAKDIMITMEEIYRVCKHKAIVCIAAPYYNTSLNVANPYHKQVFNEHTARFFTSDPYSIIPQEEYYFPHAVAWGLGASDNSNLKIDFRCIKMEYFYFPEYRKLVEEEKARLRNTSINIVDQIVIHLVVVKDEITQDELINISKTPLEEPHHVTIRRLREQHEDNTSDLIILSEKFKISQETNAEINGEIEKLNQIIKNQQESLQDEATIKNLIDKLENEIKNLRATVRENDLMTSMLKEGIDRIENIELHQIQENDIQENITNSASEYYDLVGTLSNNDQKSYELWVQHDLSKKSRWKKASDRLKLIRNSNSFDLSDQINELCRETINYSVIQAKESLDNYVLTLGDSILNEGIMYYEVSPSQDKWSGVECLFTNYRSEKINEFLAFEVLNMDHHIIRTVIMDSSAIKHNEPTTISFEDIQISGDNKFIVRFMGISPHIWGVQLYEWVEFDKVGKRKRTAFAGRLL
ncbi:methyltransferase domain-containing protein [Paenibacillus sp. NPDC058910]|uniref:methyltransferase domain-containing protein n=1 Tax=unclassified Paenibacillus TaxID=185978 RepID=UPI0036C597A5